MEFKSAIVDECGDVVYWCEELSSDEIETILANHPEWRTRCVQM